MLPPKEVDHLNIMSKCHGIDNIKAPKIFIWKNNDKHKSLLKNCVIV